MVWFYMKDDCVLAPTMTWMIKSLVHSLMLQKVSNIFLSCLICVSQDSLNM